MKVIPESSREN